MLDEMASVCLLSGGYSLSAMGVTDRIQEQRRQKLAAWITVHGGLAEVVRKKKLTQSQQSYISQITSGYSFAERAARSMERRLGMPENYLDAGVDSQPLIFPPVTLEQALEALGKALAHEMPHDVREDLADALAKLARRGGAERDQQQVVALLRHAQQKPQAAA
jgi:hypothetical protein